jgi:hypothetical protein
MSVLADDFAQFVTDIQASNSYLAFARDNHGGKGYAVDNPKTGSELQKWMVFRDQLLRGTRPLPPAMVTAIGKALVDAGVLYLDATAEPDPPPPLPAEPAVGRCDLERTVGVRRHLRPHPAALRPRHTAATLLRRGPAGERARGLGRRDDRRVDVPAGAGGPVGDSDIALRRQFRVLLLERAPPPQQAPSRFAGEFSLPQLLPDLGSEYPATE